MIASSPHVVILNDAGHVTGGAGKVAIDSAVALAKQGHQVTFVCAVAPVDKILENANLKIVCTDQQPIVSDPNRLRAVQQGWWNYKAAAAMSDVLAHADLSNTIVHVHGWTKALSSSAIRAALVRGYKTVITLHDYFTACPNGGFFDYQKQEFCQRRPLSAACLSTNCDKSSYQQKLWRVGRQFVQSAIGLVPDGITHFISISDLSESILRPYLPRNCTVYRLPNPLDVTKTLSVDVEKNNNFMFVGRISPEKGIFTLMKAASMCDVPVTVVGEGFQRSSVQQCYPDANFTGWLSAQDVRQQLRSARALVFPSLWCETQGLVVLEAAAMGVPSIVARTTGVSETIEDGITGLIFRAGDVADLTNKIKMLQDSSIASRMGRAAYDRYWESPWTMARHLSALETCYEHVLFSR